MKQSLINSGSEKYFHLPKSDILECKVELQSIIGKRPTNQDRCCVFACNTHSVFAILDGHGHPDNYVQALVDFVFERFIQLISPEIDTTKITKALKTIDSEICCSGVWGKHAGTTFCCIIVTPSHIFSVNTGDSKSVISEYLYVVDGVLVRRIVSKEHNTHNSTELERVIMRNEPQSGFYHRNSRIYGIENTTGDQYGINITRSVGDSFYKQNKTGSGIYSPESSPLIVLPDISVIQRNPTSQFRIFIASDGITGFENMDHTTFDNYTLPTTTSDNASVIKLWVPPPQ